MGSKNSKPSPPQITHALQYPVNNGQSFIVFYINLDHRTDRRQAIENELEQVQLTPYIRFPAIKHKIGLVGCGFSHIECLKQGLQSGADHILVFEDDFYFTMDRNQLHQVLQQVIQTNYNVFMLGYCVTDKKVNVQPTNHPLLKRITNACCAHGYIVNKRYATTLLRNLEEAVVQLQKTKDEPKYANDQYWKLLQDQDIWLCTEKPCGLQREGFSDIENKVKWDQNDLWWKLLQDQDK